MTNAGDLTPEADASTGSGQHRPEHQFWLTMQAAHAQWADATEALDYLIAAASTRQPFPRRTPSRRAERPRNSAPASRNTSKPGWHSPNFSQPSFRPSNSSLRETGQPWRRRPSGEDAEQGFHEIAVGPWTLRATSRFAMAALGYCAFVPRGFWPDVRDARENARARSRRRSRCDERPADSDSHPGSGCRAAGQQRSSGAGASRKRRSAEETGAKIGERRALEASRDAAPPAEEGAGSGPQAHATEEPGIHSRRLPCGTRVSGRSACRCTISIANTTASISP